MSVGNRWIFDGEDKLGSVVAGFVAPLIWNFEMQRVGERFWIELLPGNAIDRWIVH